MSNDIIKTKDGQIKIKSANDLHKKGFMEPKDNKYRIKKLISQNEYLNKPDYDIFLDELRFTKLKKYKDYQLVKATEEELKKILPNYDIKEETYLNFLGITKIEPGFYQIDLENYTDKFIRINLNEITFEENFVIIFNIFDKDKDGSISSNEFDEMISYFNQINSLKFDDSQKSNISQSIFKEINRSAGGKISKENFKLFLQKFKDEEITMNPFTRIKSNDAITKIRKGTTLKLDQHSNEMKRVNRSKSRNIFKKFWVLNKKAIILSLVYFILLFITGMGHRAFEGLNTNRVWASTLASRYFAGTIYFNMALLVLFMCNNLVTYLSTTRLKWFLPVEDTKKYHAVCATLLAIAVVPHVILHVGVEFPEIARICARNKEKAYVTTAWLTFWNLTGLSGCITLLIFMAIIIPAAIPYIRNKKYEIFLHTHKLFYLAIISLFIHGRTPDTKRWPFLFFMGLPLLLFSIELIIRLYRFFTNKSKILNVKYLNSGVCLLTIEKPKNFTFRGGQYAQLRIPDISKWEWHPFTIASSPIDDELYFYINPCGDWTNQIKDMGSKSANPDKGVDKNKLLSEEIGSLCNIDGPYGAPAEHFKSFENLVFVAQGVGVTPFSSILLSLLYEMKRGNKIQHKSISFYWIQRDYAKADYLNNILEEISKEDKNKIFDINIFVTCAQQKYDMR
jgi:respiratory burst oxidase